MIRRLSLFILTAFVAVFLCAQTQAAVAPCAPYKVIKDYLAKRFKEHPVFYGIAPRGLGFMVFLNRKTGTWTALVTAPNGMACVRMTGGKGRFQVGT